MPRADFLCGTDHSFSMRDSVTLGTIGQLWATFCDTPLLCPTSRSILSQIEAGDPRAAEQLLPLVYDELRKLAASKLAQEKPGQTLQATALVHEAYVRLVDADEAQHWNSRGHFFGAAAEAMRRILVDMRGGSNRSKARRASSTAEMRTSINSASRKTSHETYWRLTKPWKTCSRTPGGGEGGGVAILRRFYSR